MISWAFGANLAISSIGAHIDISQKNDEDRKSNISYIKKCIDHSQKIKCPIVHIFSGELKKNENNVENSFYHLQEKSDAKYMFLITIKDIKAGEEVKANYNLYTYPKTGVGIQMI